MIAEKIKIRNPIKILRTVKKKQKKITSQNMKLKNLRAFDAVFHVSPLIKEPLKTKKVAVPPPPGS